MLTFIEIYSNNLLSPSGKKHPKVQEPFLPDFKKYRFLQAGFYC